MCGIAGILNHGNRFSPDELGRIGQAMADAQRHRGPDAGSVWVSPDGACMLAHRRLSVIDVSDAGLQPMASTDGQGMIAFNGEIYNFMRLRRILEADGFVARGHSDTEVLVEMLRRRGEDALGMLDGMYAFAYYDVAQRTLLLARDPFGEKPLYVCAGDGWTAFASELSALALVPGFRPTIDRHRLFSYLSLQYVPAPLSIYSSVDKLPPGHAMRVGPHGAAQRFAHFTFTASERREPSRPMGELAAELEDILTAAIEERLVADVPLGAFLSGGIDSSTVVALARRRLGREIQTFSLGFSGTPDSEHLVAREIARSLGTRHRDVVIDIDLLPMLHTIAGCLDEPNGDTSCLPTYLLARLAREDVTVALSGDGGDEMFGGYGRYFLCREEDARVAAGQDKPWATWTRGQAYYCSRFLIFGDGTLERAAGPMPESWRAELQGWRDAIDADPRPMGAVLRDEDVRRYMPGAVLAKVDRMTMQHSLEVRAPLLGRAVADFAMTLAEDDCFGPGIGKRVLRAVAERHVPPHILARPKMGFGLPIAGWGADVLRREAAALLEGPDCRLQDWVDIGLLRTFCAREASTYQLWSLLVLESWLRRHPSEAV